MMLFIILGFFDVLAAAFMIAMHLDFLNEWKLALIFAFYLIIKAIIFRKSFLSILDILAGIYFLLIMAGVRTFLVYIFALIMIYKFVVSLMMRGPG